MRENERKDRERGIRRKDRRGEREVAGIGRGEGKGQTFKVTEKEEGETYKGKKNKK